MQTNFISKVRFGIYDSDETKRLSVVSIYNPKTIDKDLNVVPNGCHDLRMGPNDYMGICVTCGLNYYSCPGHLGHIEMPLLIYNPCLIKILYTIFKGSCIFCFKLLAPVLQSFIVRKKLEILEGNSEELFDEAIYKNLITNDQGSCDDKELVKLMAVTGEKQSILMADVNKNICELRNSIIFNYIRKYHLCATYKTCPHCQTKLPSWKIRENAKLIYNFPQKRKDTKHVSTVPVKTELDIANLNDFLLIDPGIKGEQELTPLEAKTFLKRILQLPNNLNVLKSLFGCIFLRQIESHSIKDVDNIVELFFIKSLPVIPTRFRPLNHLGDSKFVSGQTLIYMKILAACKLLKEIIRINIDEPNASTSGTEPNEKIQNSAKTTDKQAQMIMAKAKTGKRRYSSAPQPQATAPYISVWRYLQTCVNLLLDNDNSLFPRENLISVKQILEKKEGLFRKHMMGKRVDFAARSVISPDPFINIDQIGVPMVFASKLTFPEAVTPYNMHRLARAVINGPLVYPGAFSVKTAKGDVLFLSPNNPTHRANIAQRLTSQSMPVTAFGTPVKQLGSSNVFDADMTNEMNNSIEFEAAMRNPSRFISHLQRLSNRDRIVVVNRHLKNGDILLLNRQPTLHKPSIMAHKAKVLPAQRTLRLHYAHCKAYNADFDGDEMNAHYPQDILGVAEGHYIAGCQHNYLTPKDGTPLTGLIQDHLVAGVLLSQRGKFFNRRDYQDLLYKAFSENTSADGFGKRLRTIKPAILKPNVLWTGKQIISSVLLNSLGPERSNQFHLYTPKNKVTDAMFKPFHISKMQKSDRHLPIVVNAYLNTDNSNNKLIWHNLSEDGACVRNGYWTRGIFDKAHFGGSSFGLIHACQELYGGQVSADLLTALGKLFTSFLQIHGFSLGIKDLLVGEKADKKRKKVLKVCDQIKDDFDTRNTTDLAQNILVKTFAPSHMKSNLDNIENLENLGNIHYKDVLREWERAFYQRDQTVLDDWEVQNKQFIATINNKTTQITMDGLVKQFPRNNLLLMVNSGAKGTLVNCLQICAMLGQIELEGKRPAVLPTGRSLPSFQSFDPNPVTRGFVTYRFLTGLKPQDYFFHCMAGREGLIDTAVKTSHSGYLQRCLIKQLEGVKICYDSTVRDSDNSIIQFLYGEDGLEVTKCQYLKAQSQLDFLLANHKTQAYDDTADKSKLTSFAKTLKNFHGEPSSSLRDTIESIYKPKSSHTITQHDYPSTDFPNGGYKSIRNFLRIKNAASLVSPGEAVGVLAAQSIGEPSTQMTLNTFHFAGRGEMNVTLGIPRLREILMTATHDIKTPIMTAPLLEISQARELKDTFNRVPFDKVFQSIDVKESITSSPATAKNRKLYWEYKITFNILPFDHLYARLPKLLFGDILNNKNIKEKPKKQIKAVRKRVISFAISKIESILLPRLIRALRREDNLLNNIRLFESRKKYRSFGAVNNNNNASNDDDNDDINNNNENGENQENEENVDSKSAHKNFDGVSDDSSQESSESELEDTNEKAGSGHISQTEDDDILETGYLGNEINDETTTLDEEGTPSETSGKSSSKRSISSASTGKAKKRKTNNSNDGSVKLSDDSGAEHDNTIEDDFDRDYRSGSHPSSTASAFSDLLTHDSNEIVETKNHKKQVSEDVSLEKPAKAIEEFGSNFEYNRKSDEYACHITLQIPISENKVDIEALLERECKSFMYALPGVTSSSVSDKDTSKIFNVEGINFQEIFKFGQYLDLNKLYCNDLYKILEMYGIEACRNAIIREIQNVFSVYGIKVDYRHLSLVADHMTSTGTYKAFNRYALANNTSPFLKMSFESTTNFLLDAVVSGSTDYLQTPSACIVMGKEMTAGTGSFDLLPSKKSTIS